MWAMSSFKRDELKKSNKEIKMIRVNPVILSLIVVTSFSVSSWALWTDAGTYLWSGNNTAPERITIGGTGTGTPPTPTYMLDVRSLGTTNPYEVMKLSTSNTTSNLTLLGVPGASSNFFVMNSNGGGGTSGFIFSGGVPVSTTGIGSTEFMRITSGGQVGVGTLSPTSLNGRNRVLEVSAAGAGASAHPGIVLRSGSTFTNTPAWEMLLSSGPSGSGTTDYQLFAGANARLFVSGAAPGNVGIGTTTPNYKLDVADEATQAAIGASGYGSQASGARGAFYMYRANGTKAAPTSVVAGDRIGIIQARVRSGSTDFSTGAITMDVDGAVTAGQMPGSKLLFYTNTPGGSQSVSAAISGSGNVGIGTSTDNGFRLDVQSSSNYKQFRIKSTGNGEPLIKLSGLYNSGDGAELWQNVAGDIRLNVNSTKTALGVNSAGSIGIGTTSPYTTLDVNGQLGIFGPGLSGDVFQRTVIYSDATRGLLIEGPKNSAGIKQDITFNWRGGGTEPLHISGAGERVGIGGLADPTPAVPNIPELKLDVRGATRISNGVNQDFLGLSIRGQQQAGAITRIEFAGDNNKAFAQLQAVINATNSGADQEPTAGTLAFRTVVGNSMQDRLVIDDQGKVNVMGKLAVGDGNVSKGGIISVTGTGMVFEGPVDGANNVNFIFTWPNSAQERVPFTITGADGFVGIGTTFPQKQLDVNGDANISGELQVASVKTGLWTIAPDYVFEKDYKLASLEHVEKFVKEKKHLPEIPSAKQMKKDGIDLTEMNMHLLKKVEEITLHMIELNKRLKLQEKELQTLKSRSVGGR